MYRVIFFKRKHWNSFVNGVDINFKISNTILFIADSDSAFWKTKYLPETFFSISDWWRYKLWNSIFTFSIIRAQSYDSATVSHILIHHLSNSMSDVVFKQHLHRDTIVRSVAPKRILHISVIVYSASPCTYSRSSWTKKRTYAGLMSFSLTEFFSVLWCYKCRKFGHHSESCPSKSVVCNHCAEAGHNTQQCSFRLLVLRAVPQSSP